MYSDILLAYTYIIECKSCSLIASPPITLVLDWMHLYHFPSSPVQYFWCAGEASLLLQRNARDWQLQCNPSWHSWQLLILIWICIRRWRRCVWSSFFFTMK